MAVDKEEIKKNKYSVIGSLIGTGILFLIYHFGNVLGLTESSKETSYKILIIALYATLFGGTLFVLFAKKPPKKSVSKRLPLFRKWVKGFAIFILIFGTNGVSVYFTRQSVESIPPYLVKIINKTNLSVTLSKSVDLQITKPISPFEDQQIDYQRGTLSQNKISKDILVGPNDTALATLNFNSSRQLYNLYKSGQFELTVIFKADDGKFPIISNIPFSKPIMEKGYSECIIK
ncbi:hypothetical protein I5907_19440 [Panacibacter sp. DH6]|uniref:Uncharacterized protein n=1 Tax=Panacibacter microcysteis TaxID=2793269 RepID=A0A931GZV1_9BACT|nr:hypothetical protein [Panacibacter microcysteis]MBG9378420.1 hypothetical protein [Panacibacter microcysteis]